jgi:UDP-glucuronate decarboxylase
MIAQENVFLTGGTGFFGSAIFQLHQQSRICNGVLTALSRQPEKFFTRTPYVANSAFWVRGDIRSFDFSPDLGSFTHILHAAADSTYAGHLSCLERHDQIVEGTKRMLEFAVKCRATRFLFISSGAVYGKQPSTLAATSEDYLGMSDPLVADNVYSVAKRSAEHLCALYAEEFGLEVVIARCFAFIGEDLPMNVHFAIGNFIRDALWAEQITVNGDGTPIRSYLDQRDLARWLLSLLKRGRSGEAYNVGSDRAISIADLAHLVRDLVSPGKPVRILCRSVDNAERSRYVPDISKIDRHLGLRPTFTLEQSILDAASVARVRGKPEP